MNDQEFIAWSSHPAWSASEAVHVAYGVRPTAEIPLKELIVRFPDSRVALEQLATHNPEPRSPSEWIQYFLHSGFAKAALEWQALFPMAALESMGSILHHEPDYRRFVLDYFKDTRAPLHDICGYALKIGPSGEKSPGKCLANDRRNLTLALAAIANVRVAAETELPDSLVSTRVCFDNYPMGFPLDARCSSWVEWGRSHPTLVAWLRGNKLPSAAQTTPALESPGQALANRRHAPARALIEQAGGEARLLWTNGDRRTHVEMTNHLHSQLKYRLVTKDRLRAQLKDVAREIDPSLVVGLPKAH